MPSFTNVERGTDMFMEEFGLSMLDRNRRSRP